MHRMLSRNGFHRAVVCRAWDVVVHRMLSQSGFCHTVDFIAQCILSHNGFRRAEDAFMQKVFPTQRLQVGLRK